MATIKIPGEPGARYGSIAELEASIRDLEEMRAVEVGGLREDGREAAADRKDDAYGAAIRRRQEVLRRLNERQARRTAQPPGRPRGRRGSSGGRGGGGGSSSSGAAGSGRRRAPARPRLRAGASGRLLRETGIAGATTSTTRFALQVLGLVIGLALLILVLEEEGRAGGARFFDTSTGLAGGLVRFLGVFLGPADPFDPDAWRSPERAPARGRPRARSPVPGRTTAARLN